MADELQADLLSRFHRVYDNLPLEERKHVILVLENEPISWEVARAEAINNRKRGLAILKKLEELKII
jgi:hypothetical protein